MRKFQITSFNLTKTIIFSGAEKAPNIIKKRWPRSHREIGGHFAELSKEAAFHRRSLEEAFFRRGNYLIRRRIKLYFSKLGFKKLFFFIRKKRISLAEPELS